MIYKLKVMEQLTHLEPVQEAFPPSHFCKVLCFSRMDCVCELRVTKTSLAARTIEHHPDLPDL